MKASDLWTANQLTDRRKKLLCERADCIRVIAVRGRMQPPDRPNGGETIESPRHAESKTEALATIHRFYDSLLAEIDDRLREIGVDPVWEDETGAGFV